MQITPAAGLNAYLIFSKGQCYPVSILPLQQQPYLPPSPPLLKVAPALSLKAEQMNYKIKVFYDDSKARPQDITISISNTASWHQFLFQFLDTLDIASCAQFDLYLLQSDGSKSLVG
jgi:hypothetical protein